MSGDLKQAFKTIGEEMGLVRYVHIRCSMFSSVCGKQPHLLCWGASSEFEARFGNSNAGDKNYWPVTF